MLYYSGEFEQCGFFGREADVGGELVLFSGNVVLEVLIVVGLRGIFDCFEWYIEVVNVIFVVLELVFEVCVVI